MKISRILFAAALLFAGATQVQAAEINFSLVNNMGTVAAGDFGSIATDDQKIFVRNIEAGTVDETKIGYQHDYVKGLLPTNTQISFTYNIAAPYNSFVAADPFGNFAEGNGVVSDGTYLYRAWAASDNGWTYSEKAGPDGKFHATNSTLGLTAEATINEDSTVATLLIRNLSAVAANFESYFYSPSELNSGAITTTYNVSAVPLPAALPLFGLALAGVAGYSRRRKAA